MPLLIMHWIQLLNRFEKELMRKQIVEEALVEANNKEVVAARSKAVVLVAQPVTVMLLFLVKTILTL